MRPSVFVVMALMFSGVVLGFNVFMSDLANEFGYADDLGELNRTQEFLDNVNETQREFDTEIAETQDSNLLTQTIGIVNFLKNVADLLLDSIVNLFNGMFEAVGFILPPWVSGIILAILTTMIIFGIIRGISNRAV